MILLYSLFILLLIIALGLLAIPFIKNKNALLSKDFLIITLFIISFPVVLYQSFEQSKSIQLWFAEGKNHYNLMVELQQLGGIEGIITRLQTRLAAHPDDAKGWFILGKLYYSQQDYRAASDAFAKAYHLKPDDVEIIKYHELTKIQ